MENWLEVLSMVGTLVLMLAVFAGAYFASRLIGKRYRPGVQGEKAIRILERAPLGRDQSLLLVKTAGKFFLLGATPQHVEKICELDPEQLPSLEAAEQGPGDFLSVMREAWKTRSGKAGGGKKS